jgi:hypothetical protein
LETALDVSRFDRLTRSLAAPRTRRGLLGLLAALPAAGGLLPQGMATGRAGRYRHSSPRVAQRNGQTLRKDKTCKLESRAQTCRGKCGIVRGNCRGPIDCGPCPCNPEPRRKTCKNACGTVKNNCGTKVDCGSCTCQPSCPDCRICDEAITTCVADASQDEQCCGGADGGTWCQGGECVAATATIQECGGRCNAPGDPQNTDPSIDRCGEVTCPNCDPGCQAATGCSLFAFRPNGAAGASYYCQIAPGAGHGRTGC